ncbi:MAG: OmpH family outer membrane protein [Pseudomonadota bacterium]
MVVISRERLFAEIAASRNLKAIEADLTKRVQASIDEARELLTVEEAELARLRAEISAEEFEERAQDFDRRLRLLRSNAQDRVNQVNAGFQQARSEIVAALPAILARLRVEVGAAVIVNSDQVLAMDPSVDVTDRAIALFDAEGPRPLPPDVDLDTPLLSPLADTVNGEQ